jgi:two-component system chemotaxis response regulator CheB
MSAPRIRVLIVDDSAFARKVVREVLSADAEIEVVGYARDGIEGLEKIVELRPDVVTLDLMMPDLDGLGLLRALPLENPPKVVVVSISGAETEIALEALSLGAVDVVAKPTPLPTDRMYEMSHDLVRKVKAAALARPRVSAPAAPALSAAHVPAAGRYRLVAVGTSTGGPQALTELFSAMPAGLPVSFAIALHIPAGYTGPLAERLSRSSGVRISEAEDGMEIRPGEGVIAPGGMHLTVVESAGRLIARVSFEPSTTAHRPSVDVLFSSVASALGDAAMAVVLTGMGNDGLAGAADIRKRGGRVLAESESSCVVYGMPRSVIEGGLASAEAPLPGMAKLILDSLR